MTSSSSSVLQLFDAVQTSIFINYLFDMLSLPGTTIGTFIIHQLKPRASHTEMEFFQRAKAVRLKMIVNMKGNFFIVAQADESSVRGDGNGSEKTASWTVEFTNDESLIRLKSCFGKYLATSKEKHLLVVKVVKLKQTLPAVVLDDSTYWKPVKDKSIVRLESPTHRHAKIWAVDVLELLVPPKPASSLVPNNRVDDARKAALEFYANCSNDQKVAAVKMFKGADKDGDGAISYQEFHDVCIEQKLSESFVLETFHDLDMDKNGALDFEEAVTFSVMLVSKKGATTQGATSQGATNQDAIWSSIGLGMKSADMGMELAGMCNTM